MLSAKPCSANQILESEIAVAEGKEGDLVAVHGDPFGGYSHDQERAGGVRQPLQ